MRLLDVGFQRIVGFRSAYSKVAKNVRLPFPQGAANRFRRPLAWQTNAGRVGTETA